MSIERNKVLAERYPFLIPRNVFDDEIAEDYDYSYLRGDVELPPGWQKLFYQMCEDIREPLIKANFLDKFRFSQIKEKYGSACFYHFGAPEEVEEIIQKYEYVSGFICSECGKPAAIQTSGWIMSFCDECREETGSRTHKYDKIKFDPILKVIKFSNKERKVVEYNCQDIWNRLYNER